MRVLQVVCQFAASRFFSVVPEWEHRSQDSVRRSRRARAAPCILRASRRPAVLWEWVRQVLLRHRQCLALVRRGARELPANVLDNATFRVE